MTELKSRIHDKSNGLDYVLVGDYYVPDLKLPEEHRPIGMWGRLHRTYLEQYRPTRFSALCLSGELHTYLADLNEQATERCSLIIEQMKQAEGVTETMKADNQMLWVQSMNSIRNRAEENHQTGNDLLLILSSPKPTNLYRKRSDRYFLMKCLSLFIYQTLRRKTQ